MTNATESTSIKLVKAYLRSGIGQRLRISERLGGFEYVDPANYPLEER